MWKPRAVRAAHVAMLAPLLLALAGAARAQKLALKGARILPVSGDAIDSGTVLVEDGKIVAVGGADLEVPFDADVVDLTGKTLFPGMILAHSVGGMDVPNENLPVTPFVDVVDSIDPSSVFFEEALRAGITTIHVMQGANTVIGGLGRVVHPVGLMVEEMTVLPHSGLKISLGPKSGYDPMVQAAMLRETFLELSDYLERLAEKKYEEKLKEEDKEIDATPAEARERGKKLIKDGDLDDKHRNLVRLTEGRLPAFLDCRRAADVPKALALAKEHGFLEHSTLVLGPECFKAIDAVRESGRPVVLDANLIYRERDPLTGEESETFVPGVFAKAGVPFALDINPRASHGERRLWYQAARCVRRGVPRRTALESITTVPAGILGLADRLGSIAPGHDADLLVLTGDPLDARTMIDRIYIAGRVAYRLEEDVRLKELLEGRKPDLGVEEPPAGKDEGGKGEEGGEAKPPAKEKDKNPESEG